MAERITAAQAADLARANSAFAVDAILAGVRKAAEQGKYEYITREYGFGGGSCYYSEDKYPALCKAILEELRALGYKAYVGRELGYKAQCSQFVDLWLCVEWGK